jgi:TatD DNase family protein
MLIETHSHLSMPQFSADLEAVIGRAQKKDVEKIISCGFDLNSSRTSLEIAEKFPGVFGAAGIHPHHAETTSAGDLEKFKELLTHPKLKAIGEIGLDYYRNLAPAESQKKLLRTLLTVAREAGLPVIIHSRDAGDDTLEILAEFKEIKKIVFHCFPADLKLFDQVMERNYFISFTGTITFKNCSPDLKKIIELAPLEKIMLETDCPYLAPQAVRGQRNEPAFLPFIAEKIAEIKKIRLEEVARVTSPNAVRFFNL